MVPASNVQLLIVKPVEPRIPARLVISDSCHQIPELIVSHAPSTHAQTVIQQEYAAHAFQATSPIQTKIPASLAQ